MEVQAWSPSADWNHPSERSSPLLLRSPACRQGCTTSSSLMSRSRIPLLSTTLAPNSFSSYQNRDRHMFVWDSWERWSSEANLCSWGEEENARY
ncbi:hypothetical protein EYF80_006766 [Liparis tanakae]|uniref:Uncharacterized protein n=1 Tax=Liparis tanakae TaxID=230148 RepID=A0A4Z2IXT6_9TELE|nr:hypothetical protein EYF80_006766 [Liparis tanakae]